MLNKENSYNVYICGVGGQGIIKTSVIIGEAAMNEGYDVVMSEIHGMSQRGGVVSTELRIGGYKSSIIEKFKSDIILAFEPSEAVRALDKANKNTKIIFNTSPIIPSTLNQFNQVYPSVNSITESLNENYDSVYPVEGEKLAIESGSILSLNMVLLGAAIANDTFPLSKKSIIESMKNNLNSKFHNMNLNAIEKGYNIVKSS
ncbi:MAG: indolepyruvate oxidoreductase subunit beta [Methanobrevibacter arboriphilus]|uniref:Indolepyruvate ferredoxin oxidoreductase subunit beta n=1 Tax=Methanobrevibacter arboriphilus TaxID=39441 RepID=A0A843AL68_METAZ|nr:indolepyruvate oxidoreductase subunit beta [Methanobrevibacter arboriphilus]MBF4468278.1 indolepyruvate oxidoreductase subunit beta [Methanobrevibacter arboriphilus]